MPTARSIGLAAILVVLNGSSGLAQSRPASEGIPAQSEVVPGRGTASAPRQEQQDTKAATPSRENRTKAKTKTKTKTKAPTQTKVNQSAQAAKSRASKARAARMWANANLMAAPALVPKQA
ncbi:MAG: hypothetical protein IRY99_27075 [Isosphaeraceae bacterium]|nr:hypothetical protein [Isosphaeraceae bacterium]